MNCIDLFKRGLWAACVSAVLAFTTAGCGSDGGGKPQTDIDWQEIEESPSSCLKQGDCESPLLCNKTIGGGTCLPSCETGDGKLAGDEFCKQAANDSRYLCHAYPGGLCGPKCKTDADCADGRCDADGRCIKPAECKTNDDCGNNLICMTAVDDGKCLIDCRSTWEGKTGDELCESQTQNSSLKCRFDGTCAPACLSDDECKAVNPLYVCDSGSCKKLETKTCQANSDCPQGLACHGETANPDAQSTVCAASCTVGFGGKTGNDYCAWLYRGTVCHASLAGACRPKCSQNSDCSSYASGLVCSNAGTCIIPEADAPCSSGDQCENSLVCHLQKHVKSQTLGTCMKSCVLAGDEAEQKQFCQKAIPGSVCNSHLGGQCQTPCASDAVCKIFGDSFACFNGSLCRDESTALQCEDDLDCPYGKLCHNVGGGGFCGVDCRAGDDSGKDNAYCDAKTPSYICHSFIDGRCGPRCIGDYFCKSISNDLSCRADGECAPSDAVPVCVKNEECPTGQICHKELPGAACLPGCETGLGGKTGDDFCRFYSSLDSRCYPEFGGQCLPACADSSLCMRVDPAYVCQVNAGKCYKPYMPETCASDAECPYGMSCSQTCGGIKCAGKCASDADCPSCGASRRYCSSGGSCKYQADKRTPCRADSDCGVNEICHVYGGDAQNPEGACMAPCSSHSQCMDKLGSAFYCHSSGVCKKGSKVSPVLPTQRECDSDADCQNGFLCAELANGRACLPECSENSGCTVFQNGLFCDNDKRCRVLSRVKDPCESDADCSINKLCHKPGGANPNACGARCSKDADCGAYWAGSACDFEGRCVETLSSAGCASDADCRRGEICHPQVGEAGTCAPKCSADAECEGMSPGYLCAAGGVCKKPSEVGGICSSDANCPVGKVCMNGYEPAYCYAECKSDSDCSIIEAASKCRSDGRCVKASAIKKECSDNLECGFGFACSTKFSKCAPKCEKSGDCDVLAEGLGCAVGGACDIQANAPVSCLQDSDCAAGQLCQEGVSNGVCLPPCKAASDCAPYSLDFCDSYGKCARKPTFEYCSFDAQCPIGEVCHTRVLNGACMPACDEKPDVCQQANAVCYADAKCHPPTPVTDCASDADCIWGEVCHVGLKGEKGVCAASCKDDSMCSGMAGDALLYCSQSGLCKRPPQ